MVCQELYVFRGAVFVNFPVLLTFQDAKISDVMPIIQLCYEGNMDWSPSIASKYSQ